MATQTYSTPGSYTFTLPISTGITIKIAGAAGGTGGTDGGPPAIVGGSGGRGRYGVFTLPDYSYGEFTFVVGGAGGNGGNSGTTAFNGGTGGSSATSAGGGGQEDSPSGSSGGGAGGGGASSVTFGGSLIAIAGGGGGGGGGTGGATSNLGSYRTDGEDAGTFSADSTSPTDTPDASGSTTGTGGDGGGAGGGGGGYVAGARGRFPGNDGVHPAEGGFGGGSFYRSDRLTLSSQTTYTASTNGYIEIEYTSVSFDQSAATVSKAGPYFASGEIKFSQLRRNFRAQSRKTSGGGSETFATDNNSISASQLRRDTSTSNANPIVPNCQENIQVSASNNWKTSQFRNTIKFFYLTQSSSSTSLNYVIHGQPWNNNLTNNIVKTMFIEGTCGSITSTAAARFDAQSYNLHIHVLGSILGDGGSAGTETADGGDGGDALYIDSNGAGTVTVKTVGASAQVYGGGGGGGGGGDGGTGGGGQYSESYTEAIGTGYSRGGPGDCGCPSGNYCSSTQRTGNGHPCCGGGQGTPGECFCCFYDRTVSYTVNTNGGAGGDGADGGLGEGYLQSRTFGPSGTGGSGGGRNAGTGGDGGDGGDGGTWGQDGEDGETGDTGSNGNRTSGSAGASGTSGGTAGRAVAGSGYSIDTTGVDSAYLGLK